MRLPCISVHSTVQGVVAHPSTGALIRSSALCKEGGWRYVCHHILELFMSGQSLHCASPCK